MRSVIYPAATALGLATLGLLAGPAGAQQETQPKQDCQQAEGIQPAPTGGGMPQDQSCNTVFQDADLVQASIAQQIQDIVDASPSLVDGPFRRANTHLDYIVIQSPLSGNSGNITPPPGSNPFAQIDAANFNPGVSLSWSYTLTNLGGGKTRVKIKDTSTGGNQILNGCFDALGIVKSGGKQQVFTAIGEIDMWYLENLADPSSDVCGISIVIDHGINEVRLFLAVGPSGFYSPNDIAIACAALNLNPSAQQHNVQEINGAYPESGDGLPPATNRTGCFGDGARYCDFGEVQGLPNACSGAGQGTVGAPDAFTKVSAGPPIAPPGLAAALQALEAVELNSHGGANDQTSSTAGGVGGGSAVPCCSFPKF